MAKTSFASVWNSSNDTEVRAWIQEFSDMLGAIGLTQTDDTGQINISTATYALNTTYGYQIWRFNDSLQGAAPIFLRFEYRQGALNTRPHINLFIGSGSNGSGTLTNSTIIYNALSTLTTSAGVTHSSYACYNGAALGIAFKVGSGNAFGFFLERTHDSAGAPTAGGLICFLRTGTSTPSRTLSLSHSAWGTTINPTSGATLFFSPMTSIATAPANEVLLGLYRLPSGPPRPMRNFVYIGNNTLSQGETAQLTPYASSSQDYIAVGRGDGFSNVADANSQILMPWED
jgi:hypothetical protein